MGVQIDRNSKAKKQKTLEKTEEKIALHPALSDARWLDVPFLVGPNKEEVTANRAVLASLNPVLSCILFGTGAIKVVPSTPIEWSDHDVVAVRQVFHALVQRTEEVLVPMENVDSAEALVDYLMESASDLNLRFDTPFKQEFAGVFRLMRNHEEDLTLEDA